MDAASEAIQLERYGVTIVTSRTWCGVALWRSLSTLELVTQSALQGKRV